MNRAFPNPGDLSTGQDRHHRLSIKISHFGIEGCAILQANAEEIEDVIPVHTKRPRRLVGAGRYESDERLDQMKT